MASNDAHFLAFSNPNTDQPGLVVSNVGKSDDLWWRVVINQAWDGEWWVDDPTASWLFDGKCISDEGVEPQWRAWVHHHVEPPQWRWYAWRHDLDLVFTPDGSTLSNETWWRPDGIGMHLDPADENEPGAFLAALVILRSNHEGAVA
jgi:hypothetical protein